MWDDAQEHGAGAADLTVDGNDQTFVAIAPGIEVGASSGAPTVHSCVPAWLSV